jgi:hypothetical protein
MFWVHFKIFHEFFVIFKKISAFSKLLGKFSKYFDHSKFSKFFGRSQNILGKFPKLWAYFQNFPDAFSKCL